MDIAFKVAIIAFILAVAFGLSAHNTARLVNHSSILTRIRAQRRVEKASIASGLCNIVAIIALIVGIVRL